MMTTQDESEGNLRRPASGPFADAFPVLSRPVKIALRRFSLSV